MLRITQNTSASSAIKYFDEGLSKSDYYAQKNEITGEWGGYAAAALGLTGEVKKQDFHNLCYNINPATGKRLTARNDVNRTTGYDFTFSVPKSVSIIHSQTGDPDILAALNTAIRYAMTEAERNAETRVRKKGKAENRTTGNLIWAAFTHEDARPVNGVPDPHLHQHVFVFNATFDATEKQWKAGQFRNVKADAPYYEAMFHNRLAYELKRVGYAIERNERDFEIAGFKRSTIDKFSNRTLEVNKRAKEQGITSDREKDKLGARTRANKRTGLDKKALKKEWTQRLEPDELKLIREAKNSSRSGGNATNGNAAANAINHAIKHGLERKSIISQNELMTQALKYSMGSASKEELEAEMLGRNELLSKEINKKKIYTHTAAIDEEKKLIAAARAGRGKFRPVNGSYVPQNKQLNEEQVRAVKHALQSKDFITIITGGAGTGKTWAVKEIAKGAQGVGIDFYAFAPSSSASRDVQREEGFLNATTIAALLQDKKLQQQLKNGVLWIDEAGLVGCKTLNEVITIANEQKARLLLTGDTRQHTAVERGDGLRILQKFGGIKPAYINKIQRQKTDVYKEAIEALSKGNIKTGYELLNKMDSIKESETLDGSVNALAQEYVSARKVKESVLVVAATHRQGQAATIAIREALKKENKLGKKDKLFDIQLNLALTEAQKRDKAIYEPGQAVQFHQNVKGFVRGQKYDVGGKDDDGNILVAHNGHSKLLPLQEANKFSVYKKDRIGLANGDLIRITQNGFSNDKKRLSNGNILVVKGFSDEGHIIASTGKNTIILDRNYCNLTHGYYTTSPASQGKSVNRVLILQTSETGKAASKEQFYVSASRGKFSISIYTDNKERLLESVQRTSARISAMEILASEKTKSRVFAVKEKLNKLGEMTRAKVPEAKEALKSRQYSNTNIPEMQKQASSRSR